MATVSITWTYTTDPLVVAALGSFHVFPVDEARDRLAEAIIVLPDEIPNAAEPLLVEMPSGATAVEVVPVDAHGYEGATSYLQVQLGLPAVLHVAQVVMVVTAPARRHAHDA